MQVVRQGNANYLYAFSQLLPIWSLTGPPIFFDNPEKNFVGRRQIENIDLLLWAILTWILFILKKQKERIAENDNREAKVKCAKTKELNLMKNDHKKAHIA